MPRRMLCVALLIGVWPTVAGQAPLAAQDATPASPAGGTGTITGRVTDEMTGQPVADVYITVGYKGTKLVAITDASGDYRVPNVLPGQPADVFGFHGGGYRYHNSLYDDHLHIALQPGQTVTFEMTASGGKGGLSDEVFAASPALGRLALLTAVGGDRFRGTLTVPADAAPGDYPFAFFAASNDCYDNHTFPVLTLHVGEG